MHFNCITYFVRNFKFKSVKKTYEKTKVHAAAVSTEIECDGNDTDKSNYSSMNYGIFINSGFRCLNTVK